MIEVRFSGVERLTEGVWRTSIASNELKALGLSANHYLAPSVLILTVKPTVSDDLLTFPLESGRLVNLGDSELIILARREFNAETDAGDGLASGINGGSESERLASDLHSLHDEQLEALFQACPEPMKGICQEVVRCARQ